MTAQPLKLILGKKARPSPRCCGSRRMRAPVLYLPMAPAPECPIRLWRRLQQVCASAVSRLLRYQFPYMEKGSKRPDAPGGRACDGAGRHEGSRALKSRTAADRGRKIIRRSHDLAGAGDRAAGERSGTGVSGFSIASARQAISTSRAAHLSDIEIPMLFLQGTRDDFAEMALLEPVVKGLGGLCFAACRAGGRSFPPRAGAVRAERPGGHERSAGRAVGLGSADWPHEPDLCHAGPSWQVRSAVRCARQDQRSRGRQCLHHCRARRLRQQRAGQ